MKVILDGKVGIQNLVKELFLIYESSIVNINGEADKNEYEKWYEASYIIGRYKTLTGVEPKQGSIRGSKEARQIDWIRDETKVKEVMLYQEYTKFKRAKFDCTGIKYDENTGRVIEMNYIFNP